LCLIFQMNTWRYFHGCGQWGQDPQIPSPVYISYHRVRLNITCFQLTIIHFTGLALISYNHLSNIFLSFMKYQTFRLLLLQHSISKTSNTPNFNIQQAFSQSHNIQIIHHSLYNSRPSSKQTILSLIQHLTNIHYTPL